MDQKTIIPSMSQARYAEFIERLLHWQVRLSMIRMISSFSESERYLILRLPIRYHAFLSSRNSSACSATLTHSLPCISRRDLHLIGQHEPYHQPGVSCLPPETPSTNCNTGSRRYPHDDKERRTCLAARALPAIRILSSARVGALRIAWDIACSALPLPVLRPDFSLIFASFDGATMNQKSIFSNYKPLSQRR